MRSAWAGIFSLFSLAKWIALRGNTAAERNCRKEVVPPRGGDQKCYGKNLAIVERLIVFAESRNHTVLDLAFTWLLAHKPGIGHRRASKPNRFRRMRKQ